MSHRAVYELEAFARLADDVTVEPVAMHGDTCEVVDSDAKATMFSVYVRILLHQSRQCSASLAQVVADFDTRAEAETFAAGVAVVLAARARERDRLRPPLPRPNETST
jgi:hypothetical protein